MAVNTRDATIQYDVAFALVWVTDDSPALNRNEAYAFADCTGCAAVSVAFQVVLVTGNNHVAAPQNISAAVNYDCVNCLTYALATQLFVTLDGPLSDAGQKKITALWAEIAQFGSHITEVPLSEIRSRLTTYEQQIMAIIEKEQGPLTDTPSASPTDQASASPTDGGTPGATDAASPGADPTGSGASADPTDGSTAGSGDTGSAGSSSGSTSGPSSGTAPSAGSSPAPTATASSPAAGGTAASPSADATP
jgi:putative peptide zinc metalloprotease protein